MNRKLIRKLIHGIELNKWIAISYYDEQISDVVPFLVGVDEIDSKFIHCTKVEITTNTITTGSIPLNSIRFVMIIEGTRYDTSKAYNKIIDTNLFNYSSDYTIDTLFDYYFKCSKEEIPYSLKPNPLSERFAYNNLVFQKEIQLDDRLYNDILELLLGTSNNKGGSDIKFAFNTFGIHSKDGTFYPIAYKEMHLDISSKRLVVSKETQYNFKFFDTKTSRAFDINDYINADIDEFLNDINEDIFKYTDIIKKNLEHGDEIDQTGMILYFERSYSKNVFANYEKIKSDINFGLGSVPIKAFMGLNKYRINTNPKNILTFSNDLNIDQLRTIQKSTKQYMTYVQAPPGSRSLEVINNILLTSLVSRDKVLLTSKNTTHLETVYDYFQDYKYEKQRIYFPMLILNDQKRTIDYVKHLSKNFNKVIMKLSYTNISLDNGVNNTKETANLNQILDKIDNNELINDMIRGIENSDYDSNRMKSLQKTLHRSKKTVNETSINKIQLCDDDLDSYLYNECLKRIKTLFSSRYYSIRKVFIRNYETEYITDGEWYQEIINLFEDEESLSLLTEVFPIILVSNDFLKNITITTGAFDLAIINEASNCSVTDGLFALAKAKRALVIGDILDSKPLTSIDPIADRKLRNVLRVDKSYHYSQNSILSILDQTDKVSDRVLLKEHSGCRGKIINYSNRKYYGDRLTITRREIISQNPLQLHDVKKSEEGYGNTCLVEMKKVIELIVNSEYPTSEIGVLTPFSTQKKLIENALLEQGITDVECYTINDYQYQRKTLMIVSLAITIGTREKTLYWLKNDLRLCYYATTAALEELAVVCNKDRVKHLIKDDCDLMDLLKYIHFDADFELTTSISQLNKNIIDGIREYDYVVENNLLQLLRAAKKDPKSRITVLTKDVMKDFYEMKGKEFRYHFNINDLDFVLIDQSNNILCIVELSGIRQTSVGRKNLSKIRYCEREGYTFISLPTLYSRRYKYVLELLREGL